ncbi:hypothetical protein I5F32_00005, partial [Pseudomonas aeruginosa]|nr:hypothetical protein [Pseudomonas aeruginosa]
VGYLTHMAHVGIALLGIGEVSYRGSVVPAGRAGGGARPGAGRRGGCGKRPAGSPPFCL